MKKYKKASFAGLIIALGIVYGDIGTSPLYTVNALTRGREINELLVIGGVSCVLWTLTLLTTLKYVLITLNADNNGEGGIFSIFALVRKHAVWIILFAMVGGAALLADGLIVPPITVTSAVEGLGFEQDRTVLIVLIILAVLFFMQKLGTKFIGRFFGPVMLIWFLFMAAMGAIHLFDYPRIFLAINPYYAIKLLITYPSGFWLLGAVFLCTTGAEALYSDLGHCGKYNIRISWFFVKASLFINYLGQGAWLLSHYKGEVLPHGLNPFFGVMPAGLLVPGIILATLAAIIASQGLISGSFTLISEAIKLNLWPKMRINYPTTERGQVYMPLVNTFLWIGCTLIVLGFQKSANMEGAYGLAITLTMLMTSVLLIFYFYTKKVNQYLIIGYGIIYGIIEISFLVANLQKFPPPHDGFVTIFIAGLLFAVMFIWQKARKIKKRFVEFVQLNDYVPIIQELSNDRSIPKYATHLVYLTSADYQKEIEHKIIYSILYKRPKRADIYWFVHVETVDDPYTMDYVVQTIIPNEVIRVEFHLGFRVEHRIQVMFIKVVKEMVENKEVNVLSRYESLSKNNVRGDFRFIVLEKFLSRDNDLSLWDKTLMNGYFWLKKIGLSEEANFGLDANDIVIEKFPLVISPVREVPLKRIGD